MDPQINLLYLAKPIYGGWVTFTAHLSHKLNSPIIKLSKRTEKKNRIYGYDREYKNMNIEDVMKLPNIIITAVDKHYWKFLHLFPENTKIVIHDPTECKNSKQINPLVQVSENNDIPLLKKFSVITIRKSVQEYLKDTFTINSQLISHPFHTYELTENVGLNRKCVSIARIDFDKNTDILLKANKGLTDENKIYLFGAENRLYVHHKLKELEIEKYWMGKFPKNLSPSFDSKSILKDAKYMIDMSTIKDDGGGTQYTFLEAIYEDCVLVLHNEWINKGNLFKSGYNCLGVSDEKELIEVLTNEIKQKDYNHILQNSKKLLTNHTGEITFGS